MDYKVNDKGFAKWMASILPETLFNEYYKIYQNEIKSALIQRQKIWYGDGMEEITPAMLSELKTQQVNEMNSQSILLTTVISYMELFLNQFTTQTENSEVPVSQPQNRISNCEKNELRLESVPETVIQPPTQEPVIAAAADFRHEPFVYAIDKSDETRTTKKGLLVNTNKQKNVSETLEENIDGMALHKDLSFTDYKFTQPDSFTYKGETYRSKSFADIYIRTLELLIRDYPEKMSHLVEKYPRWFKNEPFGTTTSKQLSNGIYAGTNYHRYDFAKFLQKIFDDLGLSRNTMFIDSHRDYKGYSHDKNKMNKSMQTETVILHLNEDWSFKLPISYKLRGKQTTIESRKWVDFYISVLEDLIRINSVRMGNLPYIDGKCFSYNDFPSIRFRVLSNGIRAAAGLKANQIEEMIRKIFAMLNISNDDLEIQVMKEI